MFHFFAVTLDYKALCLLLNKKNNEDFVLGGKGYGSEFCSFCDAIRVNIYVCCHYNGKPLTPIPASDILQTLIGYLCYGLK